MNIKTTSFFLGAFIMLTQFVATCHATNLPDDVLLLTFSKLENPKEVIKKSSVSKRFNSIICGLPLYKSIVRFCHYFTPEDVNIYAMQIVKLKSNPHPDFIDEATFKKAQENAKFLTSTGGR
ncbi:MAG: hypothetical protein BGO77_01265 [Caedibacter sp. 37-49]|nr:MAG: hypothetical protein BGO77_01265 [Caedibacter sp. 37-49]